MTTIPRFTSALLAALAVGALPLAAPSVSAATPSADRSARTAASGLKPQLGGLLTRGIPSPAQRRYLSGFAVVPDWSQIEPSRGRFDFGWIDRRVAQARGAGLHVRLRVIAGTQAPAWAKTLGGGAVQVYDHQRHRTSSVGRFWTAAYQQAWHELQSALAHRYDTNPTVRSVDVTGTGLVSGEVCLLMAGDRIPGSSRTNGDNLLAAGYTEAARQHMLAADIAFTAAAWPHTHVGVALSPMQTLARGSHRAASAAATVTLWKTMSAAHRNLTGFNTGFSADVVSGRQRATSDLYRALIGRGDPFDVQTVNPAGEIGNPATLLGWAVQHGMDSLELPGQDYWQNWGPALLSSTNTRLAANAARQS